MNSPHSDLADFPVVISLPVQWGDQDAVSHVNNVVYFRWFESARIAYIERCDTGFGLDDSGIGPILASTKCDYKRQLTYPDTVHIGARVNRMGNSSCDIAYVVVSETHQVIAATGESTIVVFDFNRQRPIRIPDELRAAVKRIEGNGRRCAD